MDLYLLTPRQLYTRTIQEPELLRQPWIEWEVHEFKQHNPVECRWCLARMANHQHFNMHFNQDHRHEMHRIVEDFFTIRWGKLKISQSLHFACVIVFTRVWAPRNLYMLAYFSLNIPVKVLWYRWNKFEGNYSKEAAKDGWIPFYYKPLIPSHFFTTSILYHSNITQIQFQSFCDSPGSSGRSTNLILTA